MTKKSGGTKVGRGGGWKAKAATGNGRSAGTSDLFAWRKDRDATLAKANKEAEKNPKIVNIDRARADRAKQQQQSNPSANRSYYAKGLGAIVPKLTRQAIGTKASLDSDLQIYWKEIVGEEFALSTFPRRSRFDHPARRVGGVLEMTVERGYGAFMTHAKGQLLEKLNAYLGLGTFRDVKFKEGPLPSRRDTKPSIGRNRSPLMHIDLNDKNTRGRLGMVSATSLVEAQAPMNRNAGWTPPTPSRHRLNLVMEDRGGTGVDHKPLAEALTYLGASLANRAPSQ